MFRFAYITSIKISKFLIGTIIIFRSGLAYLTCKSPCFLNLDPLQHQRCLRTFPETFEIHDLWLRFHSLQACVVSAVRIVANDSSPADAFVGRKSHLTVSRTSTSAVKCALAIFSWSFLSYRICRWAPDFETSSLCPPHESPWSALVGVAVWTLISSTFVDLVTLLSTASFAIVSNVSFDQ